MRKALTIILSVLLVVPMFVSCNQDDIIDDLFEPTYSIKVAGTIGHGTVSADKTNAHEGDTVTLTATPAEGYEFSAFSVTDDKANAITVTDGSFTMPADNVTVGATFSKTAETINQEAAAAVTTKIGAIGTVSYTTESKTKIDEARTAYDALTSEQKELVTNYSTLTTAESTYSTLKAAAEQQAITLSCATSTVEKGASITGTVAFSNFETTPTVVDVYIEGQEAAVKSNAPLTNGTFTINMSNLMVGTHMVYVKSGSVESNHISVTITKKAGSISYATASVSKTTDDAAFTNELTKTGDGTVTYASSDETVATVNASTGEVTIVGAGTATITATVADSDTYTYSVKTASYTVKVLSETLLTTITATGQEQASYSTENVATVSFSYTTNGSSSYYNNGTTNWG